MEFSHNLEFAAGVAPSRPDPRVVALLNALADEHKLTVAASTDGGVDISAIDGRPVSVANSQARAVAIRLQDLDASIRPDEIGTPWAIDAPGYFTDSAHDDVLHIGFATPAPVASPPPRHDGGGLPRAGARALLSNPNLVLDDSAVADLRAGRVDPRVVAVLSTLSEHHALTISHLRSDHPRFTAGGSVSNHSFGRAADIAAIDGVPVNASNFDARELALSLQDLPPSIRPDEIGTPWAIIGPGYFTDGGHQGHLHIGFCTEIDPEAAPADLGIDAPAPAARTADVGHESMSFMAAVEPRRRRGRRAAGARATAAVAEAERLLGTPYQWGGATPQTGFDCSGLVQWAYAQAGLQVPRVAEEQMLAGTPVTRSGLLPGDLVFFRDPNGAHHVGMSLGGNAFIHVGDAVTTASLEEFQHEFTGARRFDAPGSAQASPTEVATAHVRLARDAAEVRRPDSALFRAVAAQEAATPAPEPSRAPLGLGAAGLPPELLDMVHPDEDLPWFVDRALEVKRRRVADGDVNFGQDPSQWEAWIAEVRSPGP